MTKRFEIDITPLGDVGSRVVVEGADLTRAVRGLQVTSVAGEPTLLALMPAAGYAGRITGEGEVLEMTEGVGAVEFLQTVSASELEQTVMQFMSTPDGSHLSVAQGFLSVLLAQAIADGHVETVESGT